MSDSKRSNRISKAVGKMRFVTRTKWESPIGGSKPYWSKICEGIESRVARVRKPSVSQCPIPYPTVSPSIRSSASGPDINVYDFAEDNSTASGLVDTPVEPVVKVYPPSPRSPDLADRRTVKFLYEPGREPSGDKPESASSLLRLEKLSRMTKLVNDFLSSTRNRVRPVSASSRSHPSTRQRSLLSSGGASTREQSPEDRSTTDTPQLLPIVPTTFQESSRESTMEVVETSEASITLAAQPAGLLDDVTERDHQKFDPGQEAPISRMGRPRAPSLSVASALPSFGRVVISIEDIDSNEEEDEKVEVEPSFENLIADGTDLHPKDHARSVAEDRKPAQDFLRVPEVRTTGHAFYPIDDRPKLQRKIGTYNAEIGTYNAASRERSVIKTLLEKSVVVEETKLPRSKHASWPRGSLINVFRALRAMKHGLQSKARLESETNRFFAAPMDIYSPSGRSSMSSDDRADFIEAMEDTDLDGETDREHEKVDETGAEIGRESESSYRSVRERLMRNAGSRFGMAFERAGSIGGYDVEEDPSSFYDDSSGDEIWLKPPRDARTNASRLIDVPRLASVFPRITADRCLACMCQSLGDTDPIRSRKPEAKTSLGDDADSVALGDRAIDDFEIRSSDEALLGRSYRQCAGHTDLTKTVMEDPDRESPVKTPPASLPISDAKALKRTPSLIDDTDRTPLIGKSPGKHIINAKTLVSTLSLVSERSRSISDQDDSDQGCADASGNEIGMAAGSTSKYLAPCHMPINLKPSLEPLRALRHKKSRSIGSRVASAEKSVDSANDDDDESVDDGPGRKPTIGSNADRGPREIGGLVEKSAINDDVKRELLRTIVGDGKATDTSTISRTDSRDDEKIITDLEVFELSIKCMEENKTTAEILETLGREYAKRLSERGYRSRRPSHSHRNEKIAKNLVTLLVDSRFYLNREKWSNQFNSDLSFSSKQPALTNSRQLRRILPLKSYNLVAPILGMAEWYPRRKNITRDSTRKNRRIVRHTPEDSPRKELSDSAYDLMVHPPSRIGQVSFEKSWKDERPKLSPYSLFLTKPRRKAVTWRPLTERDLEGYDPEATLKMRATRVTDGICEEFCQWLESLAAGTNRTSGIDVEVLKDMFETDFTAEVCRTMQLSIHEMPMVPRAVALARNCPGAAELALTRRHLVTDARAERRPKRTVGFGTALPDRLRFVPPRNRVNEKWLECENVRKDLETMDAVWKGITHLSSVKGFIDWLKAHPEVSRPKALEKALTSRETLLTRQSQEVIGLELDLDQIRSLKVGDNDPDAN